MSVFASAPPALREAIAALLRHRLALIALAAFMAMGGAFFNYGVNPDEETHRVVGIANLEYLLGDAELFLDLGEFVFNFYGAALLMPLILVERALSIEESRHIFISRHMLQHFFFLTAGLFAYFLAFRLFKNGWLALFAMLVFLLHPRVYGASFGSSKDVPFASMFMIALFLTHRAFRKDTLWAFALLGAGAGILTNLRIMGVVLLAGVLTMQVLRLLSASSDEARKRVLLNGGAFALAAGLASYILLPYLWPDPVSRSIEWWVTLSQHPQDLTELFRGHVVSTQSQPADYTLTWFSITTPPFALLLGIIGGVALFIRWFRLRGHASSDRQFPFEALIIGCFAVPLIAIALMSPTVFGGWRQTYFLWAPFSLLAAFGLRWLLKAMPAARLRTLAYGAVAVGLGTTFAAMAILHPLQNFHFNFLVDRTTPEYLKSQFRANTDRGTGLAIRKLLRLSPPSPVRVAHTRIIGTIALTLPESARNRLIPEHESIAEFSIERVSGNLDENTLSAVRVYNNTLWAIARQEPGGNPYAAVYEDALLDAPAARAEYNVYVNRADRSLVYVKEPCVGPVVRDEFFLLIFTENADDLPIEERSLGRANRAFRFYEFGSAFDGKCVAEVPLPDYEIAGIRTGQLRTADGDPRWEAAFPYEDASVYRAAYQTAVAAEPALRAEFDLYVGDDPPTLIYTRAPCVSSDAANPFFLHVTPERESDLPPERRELGFDAWDFDFLLHGVVFDGKCVARAPLPDYPIASIRTGQWIRGEGETWEATLRFLP